MATLVWDEVGSRVYEAGVDRGVLYLSDGSGVPWNGLTAVTEANTNESSSVYYDGMKINDLVVVGDFSGTISAITYPDEFLDFEGLALARPGVLYTNQKPKVFNLCYRTKVGNDVDGLDAGYKIHILYNVIAIPSDKSYATLDNDSNPSEFEWNITATPEEITGFRPTAHFIFDSRSLDPILLEDIERMLYGTETEDAELMTLSELVAFIDGWYIIEIVDNEDGTWTANSYHDEYITVDIDGSFEITHSNAVYSDSDTYDISDTLDSSDIT